MEAQCACQDTVYDSCNLAIINKRDTSADLFTDEQVVARVNRKNWRHCKTPVQPYESSVEGGEVTRSMAALN